jgi:hypothetical protein
MTTTHTISVEDETVAVFPGFANVVVTKTPNGFVVEVQANYPDLTHQPHMPEEIGTGKWGIADEDQTGFMAACAVGATWAHLIYMANI